MPTVLGAGSAFLTHMCILPCPSPRLSSFYCSTVVWHLQPNMHSYFDVTRCLDFELDWGTISTAWSMCSCFPACRGGLRAHVWVFDTCEQVSISGNAASITVLVFTWWETLLGGSWENGCVIMKSSAVNRWGWGEAPLLMGPQGAIDWWPCVCAW